MAHYCSYKFDEYVFRFSVGTNEGDGVILNPEIDPVDDPEYMDALVSVFELCPAILAYESLAETASYPPGETRNAPDDYLISIVAKYQKIIETQLRTGRSFPVSEKVAEYVAECKAEYFRREQRAQAKERAKSVRVTKSPGYVYLLQSVTGAYKIGRTKNPDNRLETFHVKLPFEVEYICVIQCDDMYLLERQLHIRFGEKRVNGEWFNLSPEDVEYIKGLAK